MGSAHATGNRSTRWLRIAGRELVLVVDGERRGRVVDFAWRSAAPGCRSTKEYRGDGAARVAAELRHRLQHDAVLVRLRVDGRHLSLPEGVVQGVAHRLHGDAEPTASSRSTSMRARRPVVIGPEFTPAQRRRELQLGAELASIPSLRRGRCRRERTDTARGWCGGDLHVLHRLEVDATPGMVDTARSSRVITSASSCAARGFRVTLICETLGVG